MFGTSSSVVKLMRKTRLYICYNLHPELFNAFAVKGDIPLADARIIPPVILQGTSVKENSAKYDRSVRRRHHEIGRNRNDNTKTFNHLHQGGDESPWKRAALGRPSCCNPIMSGAVRPSSSGIDSNDSCPSVGLGPVHSHLHNDGINSIIVLLGDRTVFIQIIHYLRKSAAWRLVYKG